MKLNINGKEINIKFGYKPTLKERIISKVIKFANIADEDGKVDMEKIEDLLLFLPELLLAGMQVHHKDYRYDYDTKEGKEEQLDKTYLLVEEYLENEDADIMKLFTGLQEALMEDSFLANLFNKERSKVAEIEDIAQNQN